MPSKESLHPRSESIEHITTLDPLDVPARLNEFRDMKHGWLDGEGKAPTQIGLDWLAESFESNFPVYAPLPYTYPTPEGGVQMEWSFGDMEISLDIDIVTHQAEWHCLDVVSMATDEKSLDLRGAAAWEWLADQLRGYVEINAE